MHLRAEKLKKLRLSQNVWGWEEPRRKKENAAAAFALVGFSFSQPFQTLFCVSQSFEFV
jgi:hypothetical protein